MDFFHVDHIFKKANSLIFEQFYKMSFFIEGNRRMEKEVSRQYLSILMFADDLVLLVPS